MILDLFTLGLKLKYNRFVIIIIIIILIIIIIYIILEM